MTFLDTGGLVTKYSKKEKRHAEAMELFELLVRTREPLLTTSLILLEIGDYFSAVGSRHTAVKIRAMLEDSADIEIVQTTPDHVSAAWGLFESRQDKSWGITDCVSFVVMREKGCRVAFAIDRHFVQAGFHTLLPVAG